MKPASQSCAVGKGLSVICTIAGVRTFLRRAKNAFRETRFERLQVVR